MGKILIIGVGSAGANSVNRMSGVDSIPAGSDSEQWKDVVENAKDEIKEIIKYHLNKK